MSAPTSYTRTTHWWVRVADRLATGIITSGGMLVLIALLGICIFLVWVVVPLFGGARVQQRAAYTLVGYDPKNPPLFIDLDEYNSLGLALFADGRLMAFHALSGQRVSEQRIIPPERSITAFRRTLQGGYCALSLDDGSILLGRIATTSAYFEAGTPEGRRLPETAQGPQVLEQSVAEWTQEQQLRVIQPDVSFGQPMHIASSASGITALAYAVQDDGERITGKVLAALTRDDHLFFGKFRRKRNLLTGEERETLREYALPYEPRETPPDFLMLAGQGSELLLAWRDGELWRYDLGDPGSAAVVEVVDLTPGQAELTELSFLIGNRSIVSGDSEGRVNVWFVVNAEDRGAFPDGRRLVLAHPLAPQSATIRAVSASPRGRSLATADAGGAIWLRHATSEQVLERLDDISFAAISHCAITPKADALMALNTDGEVFVFEVHNAHPETTVDTVFGQVWYEGHDEPTFVWQSSSGSDDFEPKLGLVPLIFGTFKATIYSMIFAVPIAILAAMYTSQFMPPRYRNTIKPMIEIMASLPSVVLGFVAALVLAPIIEDHLVTTLTLFPATLVIIWSAGYIWQLLPPWAVVRLSGVTRLILACSLFAVGIFVSLSLSDALEAWLFDGDIMAWLDGRVGTAMPLWCLVLFPFSFLLCVWGKRRWFQPRVEDYARRCGPVGEGALDLAGVIAILLGSSVTTWLLAAALTHLGFDLRGELVGTYVQRNTLIVGFVMGFAVIPIIYTIAEDALSSVPEHLKAGSLACGASRWQTTVRVVMPIALSGIYSAVLIGLGRAVGETMIVVMAAGNTPILDLNPFSGLRALSANIAVELPEAVKDGTLYRVLFLAGLVLFVITFLINTVAEVVRLRLRRRAYQL